MPRLHEYVDGSGLYLKARHKGRITTYQVTPQGVSMLRQRGYGEGSILNVNQLIGLIDQGFVYTGGSGAGVIRSPAPFQPKAVKSAFSQKAARGNKQTHRQGKTRSQRKRERANLLEQMSSIRGAESTGSASASNDMDPLRSAPSGSNQIDDKKHPNLPVVSTSRSYCACGRRIAKSECPAVVCAMCQYVQGSSQSARLEEFASPGTSKHNQPNPREADTVLFNEANSRELLGLIWLILLPSILAAFGFFIYLFGVCSVVVVGLLGALGFLLLISVGGHTKP